MTQKHREYHWPEDKAEHDAAEREDRKRTQRWYERNWLGRWYEVDRWGRRKGSWLRRIIGDHWDRK